MSNDLLNQFKQYFAKLLNVLSPAFKILGGVAIFFSLAVTAYQIILSRKNEERTEGITKIVYICIGSFIIGMILTILGFYTSTFIG